MSPCSMHARPPERADHALIEECFNYSRPVMTYARNGPLSDVRRRNSPHSRSSAAYCSPCRFTLWQTSEQWHEPSPKKQSNNNPTHAGCVAHIARRHLNTQKQHTKQKHHHKEKPQPETKQQSRG